MKNERFLPMNRPWDQHGVATIDTVLKSGQHQKPGKMQNQSTRELNTNTQHMYKMPKLDKYISPNEHT
jgi:hypothetical protein